MSTIKDLNAEVDKRIKAKVRTGNIDKDSLEQMFDINKLAHIQLNKHINDFGTSYLQKLSDKMSTRRKDKKCEAIQMYYKFVSALPRRLKVMEEKKMFSSFTEINNKFINCYNDLMKNFDKYIDIDNLALPKTKLSHYLIIGITDKSDFINQFFLFLSDGITFDIIEDLEDKPLYRISFVKKNAAKVAKLMDGIDKLGNGSRPIETMINDLKKSNMNVAVVNEAGDNLTAYLQEGILNKSTLSNITRGIKRVRWLGRIGEAWVTFRYYWVVRRTKVNKEWMLNQMELLKEELDEKDPNSPEYKRLVKIIENYSVKITEMDKRLQNYMDED